MGRVSVDMPRRTEKDGVPRRYGPGDSVDMRIRTEKDAVLRRYGPVTV